MATKKEAVSVAAREATTAARHLDDAYAHLTGGYRRDMIEQDIATAVRNLGRALERVTKAFPQED